jgi:hypothetical protein
VDRNSSSTITTQIPLIHAQMGAPTHGSRHRNPRPKLTGAVTCLHQFVIRHVVQITQVRLLQLLDKTSGRIPNLCRRHTVPQRNATHLAGCDGVPVTRSLEDSDIKRSTVWRFRD